MPLNSNHPDRFYDSHIPYAKLSGSPSEIGYQHGIAAKPQIAKAIDIYGKLYKETKNVDWNEARRRSEKFLPLLKDKFPEILEELEGVAKGSDKDLLDILALNVRSEITLVDVSDGCTSLGQKSKKDGDIYIGQNWDWLPEINDTTIFLEIDQPNKPSLLFLAEAGIIGKWGFNSNGVALMLNAISSNEVDYDKLPIHFAVRKALEATSVDELIKYLDDKGVASAANFLIGDPTKYLTLEVTPRGNAQIFPFHEANDTVYHTNHLLDKHYASLFPVDKPILSSTFRLDRIKELSEVENTDASYDSFRERLGDLKNAPNSISRHPVPGAVALGRCITLYTIIINTNKKEAIFTIGSPDDLTLPKYKLYFSK